MADNRIKPGSRVIVSYCKTGQFTNDPARKLDGQEFVVRRKQLIMVRGIPRHYWELYGAESDMGVPYGFCEEDLILL